MYTVIRTGQFAMWLNSIKDPVTKARLIARLRKVEKGTLGDHEPVGEGVSELREHFGPGWRMYYVERNGLLIFMLGGGDKRSQRRDIAAAKELAKELRDGQD